MAEPRKRRSTGRATLADVAKLAGVGSMTVSRALRTPEQVSDKLREKIQQAVDELGYIPNKAAGALASGQSDTIAMLIPSMTESACGQFIGPFQSHLAKRNYQLQISYTGGVLEQEEKILTNILASSPAAIVLFGSERSAKGRKLLEACNIPVLEVNEITPLAIDLNVGVDHYQAAKVLTQQLIAQGFKNIGFIGGHGDQAILNKQLRGWQAAMLEGYLTPDHFLTSHGQASIELGAEGLAKLLLRERELDALICTHENIAMGALFECQRRVIKVPTSMAITCLDGADYCQQSYPGITAIHVDYPDMAIKASELLVGKIEDRDTPAGSAGSVNIGFQLLSRASSYTG
ncbi:LacI family DNA-binding transcriptional regulator (plasmid) [Photobacterium sp. DA100]|uniref:LacI family DNA-binding transcriptional regulator n=1 Tax=Photobacterium sp. DA100 TaxID=3027472 RepID=UPI002478A32C|nr:LacI family DNA-binding transcriptional regulator [Photobacterium sp. DA100]WEM45257.1 LacI family DNA-binding transcriptional regulator [Photobacterium sp. DA100]